MFLAAALMVSLPCSPVSIAAAASVSPLHQSDTTTLELSHVNSGFARPSARQISWQGPCAPKIVGLHGGTTLVTSGGLLFWTMGRPVLEI